MLGLPFEAPQLVLERLGLLDLRPGAKSDLDAAVLASARRQVLEHHVDGAREYGKLPAGQRVGDPALYQQFGLDPRQAVPGGAGLARLPGHDSIVHLSMLFRHVLGIAKQVVADDPELVVEGLGLFGVAYWQDQVEMRLEWRVKTERLTAFGEVLRPLMDGAGIATTKELLERAGKQHEPHAVETLLRHMYGPPTEVQMGNLTGIDTALGLGDSQEDEHQRTRLSTSLMYGTLRITDGAKVERDALGAANRALSGASDALERAQTRDEAERERNRLASLARSPRPG